MIILDDILTFLETAKGLNWLYKRRHKIAFLNKNKILNPDINIESHVVKYEQINENEYKHAFTVKCKTKKRGLCIYVFRYSWDGSEQDYTVSAFEDRNNKREQIAIVEKLPNIEGLGIKTFVIIFEADKKDESKTFFIVVNNLSDKKNIAKGDVHHRVSCKNCKKVTFEVSLLKEKVFYKKVVDTTGEFPNIRIDNRISSQPEMSCSWAVHDDEDVGDIRTKEKYFLYWI